MSSFSGSHQVARSGRLPPAVRGAALALLAVHGLLVALSIPRNAVTYDEFTHLPVGMSYWHRGEFWPYHHNPPLIRLVYALPAVLLDVPIDYGNLFYVPGSRAVEFDLARDFMLLNRNHYLQIYNISRLVVAGFSVLGGYLVFRWSRELFGNAGGLISLSLWTFSPNILAHAGLATPDVGATVIGFLAAYVFWRYLSHPSRLRVLLSGVLLGLTEAAKFSFVVLPFAWVVLAAIKVRRSRSGASQVRNGGIGWTCAEDSSEGRPANGGDRGQTPSAISLTWKRMIVHLGTISVVSLLILNDVYLGEGTGRRLGEFEFRSKTLTVEQKMEGVPAAQVPPVRVNRFRGTLLESVPVPLPEHYVLGFDDQMFDADSARCYAYLRGELRRGDGWWYYYLYCALVKGPLGTLFLVGAAAAAMLLTRSCRTDAVTEASLILPMLLFFLSVSSQTGLNAHFRYVLPAFPFAFVFVGRLGRLWTSRRYIWKTVIAAALVGNVVSVVRVHPHYLTYFNEAAGGPSHGLDHLADSNIDWGQGLVALHEWLIENAPGKKTRLAYFGTMYPEVLGINYELPPFDGPAPGLQAVSAYLLLGISIPAPNGEGATTGIPPGALAYYRRFEPVAVPGNSVYVYDLSVEEVNEVRAEMGLPLLADSPSAE